MDLQMFLQMLSCSAIVTTIALFLCGIPICIDIMRRKGTKEISGVPFLMGLLGAAHWLRYGFLKDDTTMIIVNVVGVLLFSSYCLFYLAYSEPRTTFAAKLVVIISLIAAMVGYVHYNVNLDYLGFVCMAYNILNFGSPLAGLGVVLRKKCCDTLPLPMCVANLLVSSQWFLYGNIVRDIYIMIPNGIGMALAVLQLSLFVIYPRKENGKSVASHISGFFSSRDDDVEKGDVASMKTASTAVSLISTKSLVRKLSETLDKSSRRSGSVDSLDSKQRQRTSSMPHNSKYKFV